MRFERIVKRCVALIGLESPGTGTAAHSLRFGFRSLLAARPVLAELLIAAQTGHRSMDVLRSYFRRSDLFRSNACAMIGL